MLSSNTNATKLECWFCCHWDFWPWSSAVAASSWCFMWETTFQFVGFTCAHWVSLHRSNFLHRKDLDWLVTDIWATAEFTTAIMVVAMVALRPLLRSISKVITNQTTSKFSRSHTGDNQTISSRNLGSNSTWTMRKHFKDPTHQEENPTGSQIELSMLSSSHSSKGGQINIATSTNGTWTSPNSWQVLGSGKDFEPDLSNKKLPKIPDAWKVFWLVTV